MDNSGTTMKYDDFFGLVFQHTGHEPFVFPIYAWHIYYSNNGILTDFSASKKTGESFLWKASTSLVHSIAAQ